MNNFKEGDIVGLEFDGKYVKGTIKNTDGDYVTVKSGEWLHHVHTDHLKLIEEEKSEKEKVAESFKILNEMIENVTGKQTIHHPAHYNQTQFECIEEMIILFGKQAVTDWCKLTAYKYKHRANYKDKYDEDMEKCDWYLNKAWELETTE